MSDTIYNHHIVYKTTNTITNKIYIGIHSTNNIDDGYLGSGIHIKESIKKYGKENFHREVLFIFDSRESASEKEKELVTEEFVLSQSTYNATEGGLGYTGNYKRGKEHHCYGRTITEQHKERISLANKGNSGNPKYGKDNAMFGVTGDKHPSAKKVEVNGVIYNTCTEASIALGIAKSTFSGWLNKGKANYV